MAVAGDAPKKKLGRPRKTTDDKAAEAATKAAANAINEAMAFCEPAAKEVGEPYATHVAIGNGVMSTFDGLLQFTHPINVDIQGFPQYRQLAAALKRAGASGSITVQGNAVRIKAPGFSVAVPMIADPGLCMRLAVDAPQYALGEPWRQSLRDLLPIVMESGEQVMQVSFLARNASTTVTDRNIIVQHFHGVGFAPEMVIPRRFAVEFCKIKKNVVAYGYSDSSLTVHFEDGSSLRTQLHRREDWPDVDEVWPAQWPQLIEIPDGFYQAVKDAAPFVTGDQLLINNDELRTHEEDGAGAVFAVKGLPFFDAIFSAKRLLRLEGLMTNWALDEDKRLLFGTQTLRGVMGAMVAERGEASDDDTANDADATETGNGQFAPANTTVATGTDIATVDAQIALNGVDGGFGPVVMSSDELEPVTAPQAEASREVPAIQTAVSRYLALPEEERRLYRDPQHPAYVNGRQWAEAGYTTAANPVQGGEDAEDGRRWYEGHQSFQLVQG